VIFGSVYCQHPMDTAEHNFWLSSLGTNAADSKRVPRQPRRHSKCDVQDLLCGPTDVPIYMNDRIQAASQCTTHKDKPHRGSASSSEVRETWALWDVFSPILSIGFELKELSCVLVIFEISNPFVIIFFLYNPSIFKSIGFFGIFNITWTNNT